MVTKQQTACTSECMVACTESLRLRCIDSGFTAARAYTRKHSDRPASTLLFHSLLRGLPSISGRARARPSAGLLRRIARGLKQTSGWVYITVRPTGDAEVGVGHVRHAQAVHADDGAPPPASAARQQPHERRRRPRLLRHLVQRRQALLQVGRVQTPAHAVVLNACGATTCRLTTCMMVRNSPG